MQEEMQKRLDAYETQLRAAGVEIERGIEAFSPTGLVKLASHGLRKR